MPVTPSLFVVISSYSLLFSHVHNKHHAIFNSVACLWLKIISKQSYEEVKEAYQLHFPDATVQYKLTVF